MKWRLCNCLALIMILILYVITSIRDSEAKQLKIAVLDLDYSAVQSQTGESSMNIGAGLADMIVTELVRGRCFTVIERKSLEKILEEQNLGQTARFDASEAARIGRLLGVNAILLGSVTQFGTAQSSSGVPGPSRELYGGVQGLQTNVQRAVVGIDVRLVDTETGVLRTAATGLGEDRFAAATSPNRGGFHGGGDILFSEYSQYVVGGAATKAVVAVTEELERWMRSQPREQVRGLVAAVFGDTVIVNLGSSDGLMLGDSLSIQKVDREVRDPLDKTKVLRKLYKRLAVVRVVNIEDGSAIATVSTSSSNDSLHTGLEVELLIPTDPKPMH